MLPLIIVPHVPLHVHMMHSVEHTDFLANGSDHIMQGVARIHGDFSSLSSIKVDTDIDWFLFPPKLKLFLE